MEKRIKGRGRKGRSNLIVAQGGGGSRFIQGSPFRPHIYTLTKRARGKESEGEAGF